MAEGVGRMDVSSEASVGEARAARMVTSYVFGDEPPPESSPEHSKGLSEQELFGPLGKRIVDPPYSPLALAQVVEQSSELGQCVEAMAANIEGFGHRISPRLETSLIDDPDDPLRTPWMKERSALKNFLWNAAEGESFDELHRKKRADLESTGNAYWEVVRNVIGKIAFFHPLSSAEMRLGIQDSEFTLAESSMIEIDEDGVPRRTTRPVLKRFRRFVQGQAVASGNGFSRAIRWFKEYGDPRVIDNETGEVVLPARVKNFDGQGTPMPESRKASEVIHWRIYSPRTPYGIPRWIGNLVNVLGVRRAEEVNYTTLSNNNIPSMVVTVSNGRLTEPTIQRIRDFVDRHVRGQANYSQFLLLEGESAFDGEDEGQVKIDIKPLTNVQITDALFVNYRKEGKDSIRRSWRLPELFVGIAASLNRATAAEARRLADEQIFAPERAASDHTINRILVDEGFVYNEYRSRTPNVTDNAIIASMLAMAEKTGGVTPRISRRVVEDLFPDAAEAPAIDPEKLDPDVPFSLTMAEAVKNLASPNEPGQQVTALKSSPEEDFSESVLKALADGLTEELRRAIAADRFGSATEEGESDEG